MLKNLFRPKWQHENPDVRKIALDKLTHSDQSIIEQLAATDPDSSIRQTAIGKIDDLTLLEKLMNQAKTASDSEFALKCWVSVLTQSGQFSAAKLDQFILDCQNERLLNGIIAYAENNNLRELALSGIKNEEQILALLSSAKSSRVWQILVDKIHTEDALKKAFAILKGRDKKSLQVIKTKLDDIKSAQTVILLKTQESHHILEKLNDLLRIEYNPLFEGILITTKQQYAALIAEFPLQKNLDIEDAIEKCAALLFSKNEKKSEALAEEKQISLDSAAHLQLLNEILELNSAYTNTSENDESINATTKEKASTIFTQWQNISHRADHNNETLFHQTYKNLQHLITDKNLVVQLKEELKNFAVKDIANFSFDELTKHIERLNILLGKVQEIKSTSLSNSTKELCLETDAQIKTAKQLKKNLSEKSKELTKQISTWLKETDELVDKKDLNNSQKNIIKIKKSLAQLSDIDAKVFALNFQRISLAVLALQDWKNYATDAKREELCISMQKIITNNDTPLEKSDSIKKLQQEWKALGNSSNQKLWHQFKLLADEAYLPVQQYFTEQKNIRDFNAQQCTTICEQLENFIAQQDWENADWKNIEKLQKAIQEEWKKYSILDRQEHKMLNDRFFNNTNIIKNKIISERKSNNLKMADIISKAQSLYETTDIQNALNEYQKLNEQWKLIGINFHKEQQLQWIDFKKAGDALYEKRQNLRQEADHQLKANLVSATNICENIIQLSKLPDTELAISKQQFEQLKTQYRDLGSLPKESFAKSQKQFQHACETYENTLTGIGKRLWILQLENLTQLAAQWLTIELDGKTITKELMAEKLPNKWILPLEKRLHAQANDKSGQNARLLCIEMEILAGTETPSEDSSLKMQYQMAKLAENFGQLQVTTNEAKIEDLYLRWYAQVCWNKDLYKTLENRFLTTAKIAFTK